MNLPKDLSFEQLEKLNEQLDQQLRQFKKYQQPHSFSWKMLVLKLIIVGLALVLPFVILIRSSILFYNTYLLNWMAFANHGLPDHHNAVGSVCYIFYVSLGIG